MPTKPKAMPKAMPKLRPETLVLGDSILVGQTFQADLPELELVKVDRQGLTSLQGRHVSDQR